METTNLTIYQVIEQIYNSYGKVSEGVHETLSDFYARNRSYWFYTTQCLGKYVFDVKDIPDLQSIIYGKRQEAVEAYHNLVAMVAVKMEEYKRNVSSAYEKVKTAKIPNTPNYMYSTDSAIRQQIDGMFSQEKYVIDISENHAKYLEDTIRSIDDVIYAIPNRIRLEEIKLGH